MLELGSPRWRELHHAYGPADDIPALLAQLSDLPKSENESEPWFSIWSALAHQGDVYPASFAAVPHVVSALENDPVNADQAYLQFPTWVEICRANNSTPVPDDLIGAYQQALAKLPSIVAARSVRPWDDSETQVALAAIAAAKGNVAVAEAALELTPETAQKFMSWFWDQ